MEQKLQSEKLPYCVRLSYGVGHFLNDLCASMWFTYLLVFLHFVIQFSNKMAGYLMLIGQVTDALCTPFVGFETDRWKKGLLGYGKRKSWHFIGTVCVVCSFPFIFHKCIGCIHLCEPVNNEGLFNCWAQFFFYAPFVMIFQFGWASTQISHLSLIPVLTPNESQRVELTSIRNIFTVIAGILVYSMAWGLLKFNPTKTNAECIACSKNLTSTEITPADAPVFMMLVLIVVGIGIILQIVFHCGISESNTPTNVERRQSYVNTSLRKHEIVNQIPLMTWNDWLKEVQFFQLGLLYMCTRLIVNLSQVYMAMYLTVDLHLPKEYIAVIPLIVFLSGFLISLFLREINTFLGRKVTYLCGSCLVISSCVWMWFLSVRNMPMQIFGASILLGSGNSVILVNSLSMTADLIGIQINSAAFVYGAMSFTDKISNGIAVLMIQYFHPCQSAAACPVISKDFYRKTMVFVPGGITVVSLVVLLTLSKVTIGNVRKFRGISDYSENVQQRNESEHETSTLFQKCLLCFPCSTPENTCLWRVLKRRIGNENESSITDYVTTSEISSTTEENENLI